MPNPGPKGSPAKKKPKVSDEKKRDHRGTTDAVKLHQMKNDRRRDDKEMEGRVAEDKLEKRAAGRTVKSVTEAAIMGDALISVRGEGWRPVTQNEMCEALDVGPRTAFANTGTIATRSASRTEFGIFCRVLNLDALITELVAPINAQDKDRVWKDDEVERVLFTICVAMLRSHAYSTLDEFLKDKNLPEWKKMSPRHQWNLLNHVQLANMNEVCAGRVAAWGEFVQNLGEVTEDETMVPEGHMDPEKQGRAMKSLQDSGFWPWSFTPQWPVQFIPRKPNPWGVKLLTAAGKGPDTNTPFYLWAMVDNLDGKLIHEDGDDAQVEEIRGKVSTVNKTVGQLAAAKVWKDAHRTFVVHVKGDSWFADLNELFTSTDSNTRFTFSMNQSRLGKKRFLVFTHLLTPGHWRMFVHERTGVLVYVENRLVEPGTYNISGTSAYTLVRKDGGAGASSILNPTLQPTKAPLKLKKTALEERSEAAKRSRLPKHLLPGFLRTPVGVLRHMVQREIDNKPLSAHGQYDNFAMATRDQLVGMLSGYSLEDVQAAGTHKNKKRSVAGAGLDEEPTVDDEVEDEGEGDGKQEATDIRTLEQLLARPLQDALDFVNQSSTTGTLLTSMFRGGDPHYSLGSGNVASKKKRVVSFLKMAASGGSARDLRAFFEGSPQVSKATEKCPISEKYVEDFNWVDRLDVLLARLGIKFVSQEWQPRVIESLVAMSLINAWTVFRELNYERKTVEEIDLAPYRVAFRDRMGKKNTPKLDEKHLNSWRRLLALETFLKRVVAEWEQKLTATPAGGRGKATR